MEKNSLFLQIFVPIGGRSITWDLGEVSVLYVMSQRVDSVPQLLW